MSEVLFFGGREVALAFRGRKVLLSVCIPGAVSALLLGTLNLRCACIGVCLLASESLLLCRPPCQGIKQVFLKHGTKIDRRGNHEMMRN